MNSRSFVLVFALAAVIMPCVSRVTAQTLVDRVPDDAFVYVGWQGSEALGPAYEKSKFKQFIDQSAFPELLNKTLPELIEREAEKQPGQADDVKLAKELFELVAKHQSAIYVGKYDTDASGNAKMHVGLICQAGVDKDRLVELLKKNIADEHDEENPTRIFTDGDLVAVAVGYGEKESPLEAKGAKTLGSTPNFIATKPHLSSQPAFVAYVDVELGLANIESAIKADGKEEGIAVWRRVLDASGLAGLKRFSYSAGFVGDEWASRSFIDAPAPRTGLMKLWETAPIDPSLLSRIPSDSISASIRQFDFAQLIDTAKAITTAADPETGKKFQQGLGLIALSLGRKLDTELLAPLGAQWAIYNSPTLGDGSITSMVVANKLDDAKLAKAAWGDLAFAISNTVPYLLRKNANVILTPNVDEKSLPGATVFSWQVGGTTWAPGFVVKDDMIYFSGNHDTLIKAAQSPAAKFEANPKFAKLIGTLGAPKYSTLSFDDLAASADTKMEGFDQSWAALANQAAAAGMDLPVKMLPSLEQVMPLLTPAGSASWSDDKGFYSVERSPFPMSSLVYGYSGSDQMTTVGVSALGISILLPSLNKARETANRVKGAANLKQIGTGCILYSLDNQGLAPPDLGALLQQGLTVDVFVSPSSGNIVPDAIRDGTNEKQAAWVNENSDYVYVKPAGKLTDVNADTPLAYEKSGIHGRDGINILYGDGHVDFQMMKNAVDIIQKSTGAKPVDYKRPAKAGK